MKKILKIILHTGLFLFLTILTQVGGFVYLLSLGLWKMLGTKWISIKIFIFSILYLITTFLIVPRLAPIFGREPVQHQSGIRPATNATIFLNRNYVRPIVNQTLQTSAKQLKDYGIEIIYLEANFPFLNGFPLIPHLSHNDGKKIDLNLVYENESGTIVNLPRSRSGYGVFVHPKSNEYDQIKKCKDSGYFQYDYPRFFSFGEINSTVKFSEKGTRLLMKNLLNTGKVKKIFIEPHLKTRMKMTDKRIRFHGCRAVRHDDHIHLEF